MKMSKFWLLFICSMAICFLNSDILRAQTLPHVMTPKHVAMIEQVHEIAIAPSGEKAVYTLRVQANPYKENKPASYELHLTNLINGHSIPYVITMSVTNIAFRPQHNTITFLANSAPGKKKTLYEIAMAGGEAQRIFSFPRSIMDYEWAPKGEKLAFMTADTAEKKESPLPYEPEIYEEDLRQRRGFLINLAKKQAKVHQLKLEGSIYQMHWSPNGKKLAIAIAPTPLVDDYYVHQKVIITNKNGKKILKKFKHQGKQGAIKWSPNGEKLAMLASADVHDPVAGRLFVVPADSGNSRQLQPNFDGEFEDFAWTSDSTLNYLSSQSVWSTYGSMHSNGTGLTPIIGKDSTNITDFKRASDGTTIFTAENPYHPSELYKLVPDSQKIKRLTNSNPWLDSLILGQQEVVSWKAQDSTKLEGMLIYPVNYKKGKRYPLITTVHGGPESHYDNGWITGYSEPGQVAAAQGYFVFYPNYRGSSGRGESFAKSSQGDMAGAEFDDIIKGVDELINVGVADSSKIGVTGGSYGGYATGWFATRYTKKFAAGVMFVGVSDNISKWGTSDIPEELYLAHARERVWEDYSSFLKSSPIYYAGQANTPLLIMAGKEDTRVDPSQSYELYRHIKTRTDTPVRLVLYPGEGHGNKNATARLDYNLRMMHWFNKYLKGQQKKLKEGNADSGKTVKIKDKQEG